MSTFRKPILSMTRQSGWKLAVIFGFSALLVIGLLLARANPSSTAKAAGSPTIASDKADYSPGATVTLTGAGWASGEDVQIFVNDSVGNTWSLTSGQNGAPADPVAGTDGGFTYSFSLPSTFIANYTATATDKTSGSTATTTFTDNVCPSGPNDPQVHQNDPHVGATFIATSSNSADYLLSTVNLSPSGGIPGLKDYCVYTSPQPNSVGTSLTNWTAVNGTPFFFDNNDGNPDNVPFDGNTHTVGNATFPATVPMSQSFVLHVYDQTFCGTADGTCFVTPGLVAKDLTVSKTATASFTKTYKWDIAKSVDQTKVTDSSGSHTFTYTVSVTHDSGTDGNWQVNGTITVTNPNGSESITLTGVSDAVDNGGSCTVSGNTTATIAASGHVDLPYTCTYASAPSPSSGTNTATATWDKTAASTPDGTASGTHTFDFGSVSPTVVDGSVSVTDTLGGTLGTVTSADPSPKTFTYTHTVTGTPGKCVTQDNTATFTTNTTKTTGTASKSVQLCTPVDLTVSKTATPSFTRTFTWGISKSVDKTLVKQSGTTATFNYTVTVTHDSGTDSAWQVTGKITITNPNDFEDIVANVSDAIGNGDSCTVTGGSNATVPKSGSVTLDYTCTYASAPSPLDGTNTATATWDSTKYNTPTGTASGTAPVDFSTTTPTIVDGSVTVTDTMGGSLGTVSYTDPSPTLLTYSKTVTGTAGTCTDFNNTATFTTGTTKTTGSASQKVTVCVGADLTVSKTATPSFTRTFTWGITKDVNKTEVDQSGTTATFNYTVKVTHDPGTDSAWQVTGQITVTNPNNWEAITANVSDAVDTGGSCKVTGGTGVSVPASGHVDLLYTCTYASAPSSSSGINTATATWDSGTFFTPDGSASGTATFAFTTPTTIVDGTVTVSDTLGGFLGTVSSTDPSPTTFTYSHDVTGTAGTCVTKDNTATFTTDTSGTTRSASQSVKLCVGADLAVSKTATPSFTRTYTWGISKSVDKTLVKQVGGTATFNYTVSVTHDSGTDSNWQVNGTITVNNPNDWEAITTDVSDAVNNGGSCTVSGGTGVNVPAGQSVTLTYNCSYASAPSPSSGTNTATASWAKATYFTPDGSQTGTAPVDFSTTIPTIVDGSVTVTDTLGGTLGTVNYTDTSPKTFTYSKTVNVPANNCVSYTNIATFTTNTTGTTGSASKTVTVCGPAKTGALTMGYWQNKNGQAIITNGASTAGVCNSGTWLRQYAPFQDLSANATCSQVATYVYNIIKAANASGSSMNPMLKAQMLATSLDVYFSDPALGGNKIGAPAPIGGVTIDLTKICAMIDGSGGTATCSSSFENVSSAFGGATSLTVSQMLAYAASQSNAGGITWYGNVKATQQLAKDAFDAINNQVAFSP